MGAGQIGGIATLLDIDFNNAAGFQGVPAQITEAQHVVFYLSHAMMFCMGTLIEAHVVLTPASCVFSERYKFKVFGGTHRFLENAGTTRLVHHLCVHRGLLSINAVKNRKAKLKVPLGSKQSYNHTMRHHCCTPDNLALLVLTRQFSFHKREAGTGFVLNRVRYGVRSRLEERIGDTTCRYYGWGSRRNGYLIPLLIDLHRVDVTLLPSEQCLQMWNNKGKYLCIQQPSCKSEKYGALCPDDLGSVIVCSGFAQGIMTSRLIDRPCGVGFLDLSKYDKFLTCGVDDSRDVIDHDDFMTFDFSTKEMLTTPSLVTVAEMNDTTEA